MVFSAGSNDGAKVVSHKTGCQQAGHQHKLRVANLGKVASTNVQQNGVVACQLARDIHC